MNYDKIIFLYFDGVLNHAEFYKSNIMEVTADHIDGLNRFSRNSIEALNRIVKETGAKVVITSSWRLSRDKDDLVNLLRHNKFKGEVIGITPVYIESYTHEIPRGKEIEDWLEKNETKCYCILDDSKWILDYQEPYFVWCDDRGHGLGDEEADKAIAILNGND